ncbi:chemotaxis protein CheB, partial [Vibrio furnissii]
AGHAYLAPGDRHMVVVKRGAQFYAELDDRGPVNRHKPSVDVMFDSVAEVAGDRAIGVILTGMGQDGARGMLRMRQQGAPTVAQDEKS